MKTVFYKMRRHKVVSGVFAGLADKFGWDLALTRIIGTLLIFATRYAIVLYILMAIFLPYKEDIEDEQYGRGPRKRKDADVINDNDEWIW